MLPGQPQYPEVLELLGSAAHYADAALYDATYADRTEDIAWYEDVCRGADGPVLEYGCGSGRITIPLARAGHRVVAVDRSKPLLDALRRKLADEPAEVRERVTIRRGDLRTTRVGGGFARVLCTFNTVLHLYRTEELLAFFRRAKRQLAPGGLFAFDALVPSLEDLASDPEKLRRGGTIRHPADGRKYRYGERFAYEPLEQVLYVTLVFAPVNGGEPREILLAHRQLFPAELAGLLGVAGLDVERVIGDFDPDVDPREADALGWVCRPA